MRSAPTNGEVKAGIVEIDRLFSQISAKNIPFADIHKLTAKIYSESMMKLNALNQQLIEIEAAKPVPKKSDKEDDEEAKNAWEADIKQTKDQIASLKTAYNDYFKALQENIINCCKDTNELYVWLETAIKCRDIGDDMFGYAIRNAILSPGMQNKFKEYLSTSALYRELKEKKFDAKTKTVTDAYFESLFSTGNYKRRITNMKDGMRATSPALQFSFTAIDAANTRDIENKNVRSLRKLLTPEVWKQAIRACNRKDISEDIAAIAKLLEAKGYHKYDETGKSLLAKLAMDVYSFLALCDYSFPKMIAKFKNTESYFQVLSQYGGVDPFVAKLENATNASIVNPNAPLLPEISLNTRKATTAPTHQKTITPADIAPKVTRETVNLLTPKGMITRYNSIVDQLGIDKNGKLKSNFAHNMAPIAVARASAAPPLKSGMPTTEQIKDSLTEQKMDQQALINELKYATRVKQAIDDLRSKNALPDRLVLLTASFNAQLKRIKASANKLGDVESAKAASDLLIMPNNQPPQPPVPTPRAKEKEELRTPVNQTDNKKSSTTEKRRYMTKTIGAFFTRPGAGDNDTSPSAENKKNTTRRNTK